MSTRRIRIEGYTAEEVLALPAEEVEALVFTGEPFIFQAGTATILGEFRLAKDRLTIELAQIEGGGEGVLPMLWNLASRYAAQRGLHEVEWIVHAVHCAKPNPKLRRVLERRGFQIREIDRAVTAYYYVDILDASADDDEFDRQFENDPRFLRRIEEARQQVREGLGTRLEDIED